jgi:putative restriction endonuclease
MWLEMSRGPAHGGENWAFTECLWSPTRKNPSGSWTFWELLRRVKEV